MLSIDLLDSYGLRDRVAVSIEGNDVKLQMEHAVPFGLLLNEVLTNALKHAFPRNRTGEVVVSFLRRADTLIASVCDNGIGMSAPLDTDSQTLGMQLVRSLVRQLQGELTIDARHGTALSVTFPVGAQHSAQRLRTAVAAG
jgi:two-component sensor histidine kinase